MRSGPAAKKAPPVPGSDPVEGEPIDLQAYFNDGEVRPPSAAAVEEAEADFARLVGEGDGPEGLGDDIDGFIKRKGL